MPTPDDPGPASGLSPGQVGRIGEELARRHLETKGYRVVAANYRCRWGEIDLVARDGPIWAFVEVRTRRSSSYGGPEASLTEAKARRLTLTAQHFLSESERMDVEPQWRIDLVAIRLGAGRRVLSIEHLENVVSG